MALYWPSMHTKSPTFCSVFSPPGQLCGLYRANCPIVILLVEQRLSGWASLAQSLNIYQNPCYVEIWVRNFLTGCFRTTPLLIMLPGRIAYDLLLFLADLLHGHGYFEKQYARTV